jgi:hypothetical protein
MLRRYVSRFHGTLLLGVGLASSVMSTVGWLKGVGPSGFLQANELAHAGLIQAYLLAALGGAVLWLGSFEAKPLRWNFVGIGVHAAILTTYAMHWEFFGAFAPGLRNAVFFHLAMVMLQVIAIAFGGEKKARPAVLAAG